MLTYDTALLFFSRTSHSEGRNKSFLKSTRHSIQVAKHLISSSLKNIKATGLPYFVIDETTQVGDNFGERLANAFEAIFNKGFSKIICVGNDCPSLNSGLLLKANNILNSCGLVIGPTAYGGAYLIGLSKNTFDKDSFTNIRWQTNEVISELTEYASSFANSPFILESHNDVNNEAQLYMAVGKLTPLHPLKKNVLAILASLSLAIDACVDRIYSAFYNRYFSLRAPPCF